MPYRDTPHTPFERFLQSLMPAIGNQIDWELVIVDDASREPLEKRTRVLKRHFGNRVRIVTHVIHRGIAEARNTGFNASSGTYVLMVDSDDVLRPSSIERIISVAAPMRVIYADHVVHNTIQSQTFCRTKKHWQSVLQAFRGTNECPFLFCNFVGLPILLSRTIMELIGGYPTTKSAGEHVSFYGTLSRNERIQFFHLAYVAYEYWIRADSVSSSNREEHTRAKGQALALEARNAGYPWNFSGIVLKNSVEPTIYLPLEGHLLRIPSWIQVNCVKRLWTWHHHVVDRLQHERFTLPDCGSDSIQIDFTNQSR